LISAAGYDLSRMPCHLDHVPLLEILRVLPVTSIRGRLAEKFYETIVEVRKLDSILRAFRPGDRRCDRFKTEIDHS
jgi:hypothetical protein